MESQTDTILQGLRDFWVELIWNLKPEVTLYVYQAALILLGIVGVTTITLLKSPVRSTFSQVLVTILCVAFLLTFPLGMLREGERKSSYALLITVSLLFLICLPPWVARNLTPKPKNQILLAKVITVVVWGLLIVQFLV